ncbi:hypothetical protein [Streptomyces sp. NPDC017673]
MNVQPLLDALDIREDAVRGLADGLRTRISELRARLRAAGHGARPAGDSW